MDEVGANKISRELQGLKIGGWTVGTYIDSGKSAVVCEASRGTETCAIKVYDREIVERFGVEDLGERIRRQLTLVGKTHPNLIQIYDGGYCKKTGHFYLVMENVEGKKLSEIIEELPRDGVGSVISQVASAAQFLEQLNLVHRDIKPDNVVVTADFGKSVLLDFGVIRPLSESDCTDRTDRTPFLATLRYSSPEYLLRQEEDSQEGWRALTFYQLGGLLHDMIMKYPLFKDQSEPYARLVQAVLQDIPTIEAADVDMEIIHLTKKCLLKKPRYRIEYVQWEDFMFPKLKSDHLKLATARIKSRQQIAGQTAIQSGKSEDEPRRELEQARYDVRVFLDSSIRDISIKNKHFPPLALEYLDSVERSSFMLKLSYQPSQRHALNKGLVIILNVNLLDVSTQLIQLECAAGLSTHCEWMKAPPVMMDFFEGVFDEKIIRERVHEILHLILDKAQETCESPECCKELLDKTSGTVWITPGLRENK